MESVSNNEYAATSSQTQIGSTNYIRGRELLTHFANLTNQDRRKTIVQNRSSPESSSSPNSASMYSQSGSNPIGSSGGSNNNNSEDLRACSEIYSAILSSQQSGSGIDDRHRLRPVSFSSPTRHLSEPATAAVRRSPNGVLNALRNGASVDVRRQDKEQQFMATEDPSDRTPRSCRTSPSIPTKSSLHHHQQQQQQHYHHHSQLDPMSSSSPNSSLNGLDHHQSTSSALSPPALVPSPAVFSLTQSELQELMRKTSATIPAVISAEEIKKANNSSQLYLLVPSNYPVIMTCSTVGSGGVHQSDASGDRASVTATTTTTTAAILGESLAAVTDGNQRALLERFQLSSATASPRPPSPQASSEQVTVSSLRAPRKNSTNIPPMLLQSLKDVVPSLALRGLDILDGSGSTAATGSAGGGGGGNTLPHLSSLALAYGFSPGETNPSSTTAPSVVNLDDHLTSRSPGKKGSLHPPPPLEPASLIISPSHGVSPDLASRGPLLLEDYRGAEMKIKPPPPADTGICSDGLLSADSNGSRNVEVTAAAVAAAAAAATLQTDSPVSCLVTVGRSSFSQVSMTGFSLALFFLDCYPVAVTIDCCKTLRFSGNPTLRSPVSRLAIAFTFIKTHLAHPSSFICGRPCFELAEESRNYPVFFPSNESPPTRNYMGRMGGGGGGVGGSQGNQSGGNGDSKDIRRRVSHNEVERRRRDRINTWIAELYKLLPPEQQAKSQYQSKGVVLKRVCEYFQNYDANMKTVSLLHDHDLSSLLVQPTDFNEPDQLRLALLKSSFFTSILPSALREQNAVFKQEICRLTRENHILRNSLNVHFQQQPPPPQQQQQQMPTQVAADESPGVVVSSGLANPATAQPPQPSHTKTSDHILPSPPKRPHFTSE
ncbi:unnamed protein product [Mesocestoides corti]|uniref:BHLH domain-containing protein n=1 Tax=Mesocestoides corti TaxID=53468 RepID=A0A158QVD6_MESCO|nr:unnamed protein product [Mesocestoides corti]